MAKRDVLVVNITATLHELGFARPKLPSTILVLVLKSPLKRVVLPLAEDPTSVIRSPQKQFAWRYCMFKRLSIVCGSLTLLMILSPFASAQQTYRQINLVSDVPGLAPITDPNLVNPWGLSRGPTPWWVSDNGTDKSTLYTGAGLKLPIIVAIPPTPNGTPTGTVYNGGSEFVVSKGNRSGAALFLFDTEDGTISGWNILVDPANAILKVDRSGNAVYKGMALATMDNNTLLYAANFQTGAIDVFTSTWAPTTVPGGFVDAQLPAGYAPFNVQEIGGNLFVAFAKQGTMPDEVDGPGLGYVDEFDPAGNLLLRLEHGDWMNAPWGLVKTPDNYGRFSNSILVGQFGSGQIAAFNPTTGAFSGQMQGPSGPLTIPGLWALAFGGGSILNGATTDMFFSAGIDDEAHGLFGKIIFARDKSEP
jgi:uncharacterized protein (TIGR03118 family)